MTAALEKVGLRFASRAEELKFRDYFTERAYPFVRWVLLLALIAYTVNGVFDIASQKGGVEATRFRFMIACPLIGFFFAISFTTWYRSFWRLLTGVGVVICGLLIIVTIILQDQEARFEFEAGTFSINLALATTFLALLPLRFIDTILAGAALQLINWVTLNALHFSSIIVVSYTFTLGSIYIIVCAISYWRERLLRREFKLATAGEVEKDGLKAKLQSVASLGALERAANGGGSVADSFGEVTILFCDIVDFTGMADRFAPRHLVELLRRVFQSLDDLAAMYSVEKVKTIGDSYMAITGTTMQTGNPVEAMADFALAAIAESRRLSTELKFPIDFRIGMHTGSIIGGIIERQKMAYDYWGKTVNIAGRLESSGMAGRIQVSEATYWRLHLNYELDKRGETELRGVGPVNTYFRNGKRTKGDSPGAPVASP
jgi:adenylate cyclase